MSKKKLLAFAGHLNITVKTIDSYAMSNYDRRFVNLRLQICSFRVIKLQNIVIISKMIGNVLNGVINLELNYLLNARNGTF